MNIELSILISTVSVAAAIFFGLSSSRRALRQDNKSEESRMTTLIVKMEHIGEGIADIKAEMKRIHGDLGDIDKRVTVMEQSTKQAHHRLDNHDIRLERLDGGKERRAEYA